MEGTSEKPAPWRRCKPGLKKVDKTCNVHPEHYWCAACAGWYGVPHDESYCHTMQVKANGHPGRQTEACACRFCEVLRRDGWDKALERFG